MNKQHYVSGEDNHLLDKQTLPNIRNQEGDNEILEIIWGSYIKLLLMVINMSKIK